MRMSIRELRIHTKSLLDAVGRGEEVLITNRGQIYAKVVPFTENNTKESSIFGLWRDNPNVQDVDGFVRALRKPRHDLS